MAEKKQAKKTAPAVTDRRLQRALERQGASKEEAKAVRKALGRE